MLNPEALAAPPAAGGSAASQPPLVEDLSPNGTSQRQQLGSRSAESNKESASPPAAEPAKQRKRFARMKQKGSEMLDAAFARHGMIVYDHAWKFIVGFGILSAAMALGIFFRKNEYDMFKLYSYPGAPSHNVRQLLESTFKPQRFNYFFVSRNDNILTKEGMQQVSSLVDAVKRLTVNRDDVVTDEYGNELNSNVQSPEDLPPVLTYEDLCVRDSWDDCSVLSVLELYSSERQWGRPITTSEWPLAVNIHSRKAFHLESLLGDMRISVVDGGDHQIHRVTGAAACLLRFDLQGDAAVAPYSAALERKIEEVAKSFAVEGFTLTYKLERSIADELMRSSSMGPAETVALVLATLTVLTYTVVVNTTTNYRTKTLPAIVSVASTLLGYAGGAGFIYFCGVEHTPPADATPFLVLGIGVDNAFVLLNSYCLTFLHDTPRQRIISTARDAGVSITITTMTSVAALIIGAVCPFFSISKFSIVTAFCLAWSYVLAQTIFLGCLSLDARREAYYTRKAKEAALAAQKEYRSQSAMERLPSPSNRSVKSPQSLESNRGSDSLGSPLSFQGRSGTEGKRTPYEIRDAPVEQIQVASAPQETPVSAPPQQISSSSAVGPEGHSVDMQGCSAHDPRETELLVALKKLSTYELASLMTFRMQHIWQRHREIVAKYFQSTAARFEQREGTGGGCGFSTLFGLLRKGSKTEPKDQAEQSAAAQPPVRGDSLEAGTLQEDQASAKAVQPEEADRSVAGEPVAADEALLRCTFTQETETCHCKLPATLPTKLHLRSSSSPLLLVKGGSEAELVDNIPP